MSEKYSTLDTTTMDNVGVLYPLVPLTFPHDQEACGWESYTAELVGGEYGPLTKYCGYTTISPELKDILEPASDPDRIEYLPYKVHSDEYGDRIHYLVHFKKSYDVFDPKNSDYYDPETKDPDFPDICTPCIDSDKAKGLKVFNIKSWHDDIIIVDDSIRKAIEDANLVKGCMFWELATTDSLKSESEEKRRDERNEIATQKAYELGEYSDKKAKAKDEAEDKTEQETENPEAIMFNNKKYLQSTKLNHGNMKEDVFDWLHTLEKEEKIPADIKALNFGLCEGVKGYFAYLIGAEDYDAEDDDWACAEDYEPETKYLEFDKGETLDMDWETFQDKMKACLTEYMNREGNAKTSVFYGKIITTGFDDGDLVRVR